MMDLVIEVENEPGALGRLAAQISDAGVNISAVTFLDTDHHVAEVHVVVPKAGAAEHLLSISHIAVTREREVVVVDIIDRPGELADIARKIGDAGIDLDLVFVATGDRLVLGSPDLDGLRRILENTR